MANIRDEYRVERLDRERLPDLEKLHKAVYGRWPVKDYFPKKYQTGFTGIEYTGYIAYHGHDLPAAYYGVLPCYMEYNGSPFLAAQSADTMTHPHHRNKGLFVELANRTYDLCRDYGIRLIYGFPNQNSAHGLINKLGWTTTESLYRFYIPVDTFPKERIMRKFAWSRSMYERYCEKILQKNLLPANGILRSAAAEGFGGVLRSDEFLQYKKYSKTYVIQAGSSKAWIRLRHELTVGDMDCAGDQFLTAIDRLKKLAAQLGLPAIQFQVSPGTRLHGLFAAQNSPDASFPVCFKDLGAGVPLEKIKFSFADIDVF